MMKSTPPVLICWLVLMLVLARGEAGAGESLRFGLYPYLSASKLIRKFTPLARYLSQATGQPVELELAKDYKEHIRRVGKEEVDFAFMGPISYLAMTEQFGSKPILARLEVAGHATYRGVIVVRKGAPWRELTSLQGKTFAFGSPDSTMGHYVALHMLRQAGVTAASLGSYESVENQENIALGVLAGDFDAGAVRESIFHVYEKEGLRAMAWSDPMPEHLFVAGKRLGPARTERLGKAMGQLKEREDGRAILAAINNDVTALIPATERDYQPLRAIYHDVEKYE